MAQPQPQSPGSKGAIPFFPPESSLGLILENTFKLVEILDTTSNSTVYLAKNINTSVNYAIKALSKFESDGSPISFYRQSRHHHERLFHSQACAGTPMPPNIVPLHRTIWRQNCTYLVLDYYPRGDLFSHIERFTDHDDDIRTGFLQLLDAVNHCHSLGIYHRDLKPENIFVTGSGTEPFGLVLGDFGYSTRLEKSDDCRGIGSFHYMSPENIDQWQSADAPSFECGPNDVWSLGIILVNWATGRHPWEEASLENALYRAFTRDRRLHLKSRLSISDELVDILYLVLVPEPKERITLPQLRQMIVGCHTFVRS